MGRRLVYSCATSADGTGIPLFAPGTRDVGLALAETKAFPDGVVRLAYRVQRAEAAGR